MPAWERVHDDEDGHEARFLPRIVLPKIRLGFKFYWTLHYIVCTLLGGIIITTVEKLPFVDGLFLAVASMTGAGLSTIPMTRVGQTSFMTMAVLIMLGSAPFMLIPVLVYRRYSIACAMHKVEVMRRAKLIPEERELTRMERSVIADFYQVDEAVGVLCMICVGYFIGVISFGTLVMNAFLRLHPMREELLSRGVTFFDDAAFLTVSAFANAGMTIASDNLYELRPNPPAYLFLALLIVAGNTGLPVLLRTLVSRLLWFENKYLARRWPSLEEYTHPRTGKTLLRETPRGRYRRTLQFILNHPRRLTTHIFSSLQTKVLCLLILQLITIQYVFFLISTMRRSDALYEQSPWMLAGIGFFQTLSTRAAGFSMMDLRTLNQGLIFIYAIMMYLSAFPFMQTLQTYASEKPRMVDEGVGKSAVGKAGESAKIRAEDLSKSVKHDSTDKILIAHSSFENQLPLRRRGIRHTGSQHSVEDEGAQAEGEGVGDNAEKFSADESEDSRMPEDRIKVSTINKRFLKQYIFRHSFFLLMAVLALAYSEDSSLSNPDGVVNLWYIVFEIISAYGNVGLTMGVPGDVVSLSGIFSTVGKFVVIFVMILGKHRGLPNKGEEVVDFQCLDYLSACRYTGPKTVLGKDVSEALAEINGSGGSEPSEVDDEKHGSQDDIQASATRNPLN